MVSLKSNILQLLFTSHFNSAISWRSGNRPLTLQEAHILIPLCHTLLHEETSADENGFKIGDGEIDHPRSLLQDTCRPPQSLGLTEGDFEKEMEQEEMTQTARLPRWRKEVRSQEMQMTSKSSWRWGKGFYLEFPEEKRPSNTSVSSVLKCEWQCYLPVGLVGMIKWVTVRETRRSGADTVTIGWELAVTNSEACTPIRLVHHSSGSVLRS